MKKHIFLVLTVFLSLYLNAEQFRVRHVEIVHMPDETSVLSARLRVNDALAIYLPENSVFLDGLSLEVKIPSIVAQYRDSVAYSIFNYVNPLPNPKKIDYSGERLLIGTYPTSVRCNFLIPLSKASQINETPYSILLEESRVNKGGFIFFRNQGVMKGVPDELWDAEFIIQIKPLLKDLGAIKLNLTCPDSEMKEDVTLLIDGSEVKPENGLYFTSPGEHNITLLSGNHRNENRTLYIEKAQISKLDIILTDLTPMVQIICPKQVEILLDDEKITPGNESFDVSEGYHVIRFIIGGYETVRTFEAFNGKNYKFDFSMDVEVTEE
ncbi:MAG: hypothetical protein K5839_06875 [Treponemataceae bacterium]|nr:hypothetical protein [Treponemataceae bacterium]